MSANLLAIPGGFDELPTVTTDAEARRELQVQMRGMKGWKREGHHQVPVIEDLTGLGPTYSSRGGMSIEIGKRSLSIDLDIARNNGKNPRSILALKYYPSLRAISENQTGAAAGSEPQSGFAPSRSRSE
jgi:hypothetical protein